MHVIIRTNIPLLGEKGDLKYVYLTYNEITKIVKSQQFMEKEVGELSKVYNKMAQGDLTVRYRSPNRMKIPERPMSRSSNSGTQFAGSLSILKTALPM